MSRLEHFARHYPSKPRVLNCAAKGRSPSAAVIRAVVRDFTQTSIVISRSGAEADIAAQWCTCLGLCYQLAWSATYRAWVVRVATDDDIDAML